jgi:hypothetical protein
VQKKSNDLGRIADHNKYLMKYLYETNNCHRRQKAEKELKIEKGEGEESKSIVNVERDNFGAMEESVQVDGKFLHDL